jgi:hypothetical protein
MYGEGEGFPADMRYKFGIIKGSKKEKRELI